MAFWYYGWEFTQTDPTFPNYVLSSVQRIHPSLSRFIPENKLSASVPCFQKMRLLFTNDLYFSIITCRPSRSFFLFTFFVLFLYIFTKTIHLWFFMRKNFLCTSIWQTVSVHTLELFFLLHTVYIQSLFTFKDFLFFPTHTYTQKFLHIHSLLTHTRILFHASFIYKNPSIHISFYIYINKNLFLFFMNMTFIHSASFFLFIRIFGSFYFLEWRS